MNIHVHVAAFVAMIVKCVVFHNNNTPSKLFKTYTNVYYIMVNFILKSK